MISFFKSAIYISNVKVPICWFPGLFSLETDTHHFLDNDDPFPWGRVIGSDGRDSLSFQSSCKKWLYQSPAMLGKCKGMWENLRRRIWWIVEEWWYRQFLRAQAQALFLRHITEITETGSILLRTSPGGDWEWPGGHILTLIYIFTMLI